MEAFRRQASKLREQVAKQQQAVLKQLGHLANDGDVVPDEAELQCHQLLQKLFNSTKNAKHFQRDLVRSFESFISISSKQMQIAIRLAEECCNYGNENQSFSSAIAKACLHFGTSHTSMEKERESLLNILGAEVCGPLRLSITGAPLEDARHLKQRYDRISQEVEAQAAEVVRRQYKLKDAGEASDSSIKLRNAEAKLYELRSSMMALGREATAAMSSVEAQQQQLTLQRLLTTVHAERSYHQNISAILEKLHSEMILEKQQNESRLESTAMIKDVYPLTCVDSHSNETDDLGTAAEKDTYFIAQVIHPFDAQAHGELNLAANDYVVVRQVSSNGWSEGECKGKAGWFPSAYIERRDKVPVSEVNEDDSPD
ncbi:hypothetical protein GIB67_012190 [Kingdonia uniflora]|uniref:SH3 domain-containing protein n=1 Tax=Kingdonia uniflora TaxID=39325 RepID=A0A7J7NPB0_9MAGN|nr:hypothetical protein GIB67_012190 [Kingdonia uniflora]